MRWIDSREPARAAAAGALIALLLTAGGPAAGRQMSPQQSDPKTLGWMQGFPPPVDKRVGQPLVDAFTFPKLRWAVCHVRELVPTLRVSRGLGAPSALPYALDPAIDALTFNPFDGRGPMTWRAAFDANYTDGVIVLHEGVVVYERYAGCLDEAGQHAAMSVSKSLVGLLAESLIAEGALHDTAVVSSIVPELAQSGFGNATVRQVMDMTTGVRFREDYVDPSSDIWAYAASALQLRPSDKQNPGGFYEYLRTVRAEGTHGIAFSYKSVNTDVLAWILTRVARQSLVDLLSARIWSRIGAEQDAYFTKDGTGTPYGGGGMNAALRDIARVGQLMLDGGAVHGSQVVPAAAVESIRAGGDTAAFKKGGYGSGSYHSQWWLYGDSRAPFAARGSYGQGIYVDPSARMVVARFASHPNVSNGAQDPTWLAAYASLASYLASKDHHARP